MQYFKRASTVTTKNDQKLTKTYYFCKHSSLNKIKKSNKTCPSRINLVHFEKDDKYEVTYYSTHLGHDIIASKLKESERHVVANRIKKGNNLNDMSEEFTNKKRCYSKLNDLKMVDVHNTIREYNIAKNIVNYGQSRTENVCNEDKIMTNVKEDKIMTNVKGNKMKVECSDSNIDNANMKKIYILKFTET